MHQQPQNVLPRPVRMTKGRTVDCLLHWRRQEVAYRCYSRALRDVSRTFESADLGHQRAHVTDGQPVLQALAPHQCALVNDAVHLRRSRRLSEEL